MSSEIQEILVSKDIPDQEKLARILQLRNIDPANLYEGFYDLSLRDGVRMFYRDEMADKIASGSLGVKYFQWLLVALKIPQSDQMAVELRSFFDTFEKSKREMLAAKKLEAAKEEVKVPVVVEEAPVVAEEVPKVYVEAVWEENEGVPLPFDPTEPDMPTRKITERLIIDLFKEQEGSARITLNRAEIVAMSKAMAEEFAARAMEAMELDSKRQVINAIGLNIGTHYEGFYKMSSTPHGVHGSAIKQIKNSASKPVSREAQLEFSCMINGNPTIPGLPVIRRYATELMEWRLKGEGDMPKNNLMAKWMQMLHKKYPNGEYLDKEEKPNLHRIPNALLDIILERYAIVITDVWPAFDSSVKAVRSGQRNVAIDVGHRDVPANAKLLAEPFSYDENLRRGLELLYLQMPREKLPEELLASVTSGEIKPGEMHKTLRLQASKTTAELVREFLGAEAEPAQLKSLSDAICRLENGNLIGTSAYARAIAKYWFKDKPDLIDEAAAFMTNPKRAGKSKAKTWVAAAARKDIAIS